MKVTTYSGEVTIILEDVFLELFGCCCLFLSCFLLSMDKRNLLIVICVCFRLKECPNKNDSNKILGLFENESDARVERREDEDLSLHSLGRAVDADHLHLKKVVSFNLLNMVNYSSVNIPLRMTNYL
jgi:hypothetical protein